MRFRYLHFCTLFICFNAHHHGKCVQGKQLFRILFKVRLVSDGANTLLHPSTAADVFMWLRLTLFCED